LAERAIGFWVTSKEEVRDEQGKVIQPEQRQYYPPDTRAIIFFLKNRMRDKWRNVPEYNVNQRTFKTSAELTIEIRKDILDLQADGYLKDIVAPARSERWPFPEPTGSPCH
jgi:hypothetical protein